MCRYASLYTHFYNHKDESLSIKKFVYKHDPMAADRDPIFRFACLDVLFS